MSVMARHGINIRRGSYPCKKGGIYDATCQYLKLTGRKASEHFLVFQHAERPEIWIDASVELPVQLEVGGRKGWSIIGTWNLINDRHYTNLLFPLRPCKYGDFEFKCPRKTKAFLCATVGSDLNVPGTWDPLSRTWKIRNKWETIGKSSSFNTPHNLRLVADGGKLSIAAPRFEEIRKLYA